MPVFRRLSDYALFGSDAVLNREIWKYDGVMLQAEDEIAGVGAVVGASFAGKKALTATSGRACR